MKLPISPLETRQEMYRDDPFRMLLVCMMLNQTNYKQVDKIRVEFFDRYGDPDSMIFAPIEELQSLLKPLGFSNRRSKTMKAFAVEWKKLVATVYDPRTIDGEDVMSLPGIGKYATDSWKIFQQYRYDIPVEDKILLQYVKWAKEEKKRILRESSEFKPTVVYYVHMEDDRHIIPNWKVRRDYAACVMARTQEEAIEKVENMALSQPGARYIKIMGVVPGKDEWVDENEPLTKNPHINTKNPL